jgi:hypothetical protein
MIVEKVFSRRRQQQRRRRSGWRVSSAFGVGLMDDDPIALQISTAHSLAESTWKVFRIERKAIDDDFVHVNAMGVGSVIALLLHCLSKLFLQNFWQEKTVLQLGRRKKVKHKIRKH